jgi:hypothetical protein
MKKTVVLSVLVSLAMICSCQKQESTAEAKLAQRKAELDAREHALDDREKALIERERAVANTRPVGPELQSRQQPRDPAEVEAERQKRLQQLPPELRALIPDRSQVNPANIAKDREAALQQQARDPAQAEAERQRRIQQLPPELKALIPDRSRLEALKAQKEKAIQDRAVQTQRSLEDSRNNMSGSAAPAAEAPDAGANSPSPSPTP